MLINARRRQILYTLKGQGTDAYNSKVKHIDIEIWKKKKHPKLLLNNSKMQKMVTIPRRDRCLFRNFALLSLALNFEELFKIPYENETG